MFFVVELVSAGLSGLELGESDLFHPVCTTDLESLLKLIQFQPLIICALQLAQLLQLIQVPEQACSNTIGILPFLSLRLYSPYILEQEFSVLLCHHYRISFECRHG